MGADSVDLVELVMAMEEEFDMGEAGEDELARAENRRRCGELCRFQTEIMKG